MKNISAVLFGQRVVGLLLVFLFLGSAGAYGQAPSWQSVTAIGQLPSTAIANKSNITATATDAGGNVYVAGIFYGSSSFGSTILTSVGDADVFVAKWSPISNGFVWAQRAGGAGSIPMRCR